MLSRQTNEKTEAQKSHQLVRDGSDFQTHAFQVKVPVLFPLNTNVTLEQTLDQMTALRRSGKLSQVFYVEDTQWIIYLSASIPISTVFEQVGYIA